MEEQVYCDHTVKITASPGLTIDKAGVVGAELVYVFPAGQGLVSQDVGILPTSCGGGELFADITSPYFVTSSGLKVKKDKIKITVECEEPDGWSGLYHGLKWEDRSANYWSSPSLKYKYTHPGGTVTLFVTSSTSPYFGAKFYGPSGYIGAADRTILSQVSVMCTVPGVYLIEVYADAVFANQQESPSLGTVTFAVVIGSGGTPISTGPTPRRGTIWAEPNIVSGPLYTSFTTTFGGIVESVAPGVTSTLGYIDKRGFVGSVSGAGGTLTASGYWDNQGFHAAIAYREIPYPQGGFKTPSFAVSLYRP
jgi:hypothetical protein